MNILQANIVDLWRQNNIVCITTNGFVKKSGEGVLGRGNALAMAKEIQELPKTLGDHIIKNGNVVGVIYNRVISFPVKPVTCEWDDALPHMQQKFKKGDEIAGFWCRAKLDIIENSLHQLINLLNYYKTSKDIYLPMPGVGNGDLSIKEVQPIIERYPDNRIIYCSL